MAYWSHCRTSSLVLPSPQDNVLDTQRDIRTIFFERVLKMRDPFEPLIPEEFQTGHYLTAPFHVDQKHL